MHSLGENRLKNRSEMGISMKLNACDSLCESNQKIIVSRDRGESRQHRAINPEGIYCVQHYHLDGGLVKNEKCCDYLLLNVTKQIAYFIELKGRNILEAIPQLESGEKLFSEDLSGFRINYRIVFSKAPTHDIKGKEFRKFKEKCGSRLAYGSQVMEETL